jgi:hypothetical protein
LEDAKEDGMKTPTNNPKGTFPNEPLAADHAEEAVEGASQDKESDAKKLKVTLSGRRPVTISTDAWPDLASAERIEYDGEFEFQANRTTHSWIKVRLNTKDGRMVVYGGYDYTSRFRGERDVHVRRGMLLGPDGDMPAAIFGVVQQISDAVEINLSALAHQCIADLPPEDLDADLATGDAP